MCELPTEVCTTEINRDYSDAILGVEDLDETDHSLTQTQTDNIEEVREVLQFEVTNTIPKGWDLPLAPHETRPARPSLAGRAKTPGTQTDVHKQKVLLWQNQH